MRNLWMGLSLVLLTLAAATARAQAPGYIASSQTITFPAIANHVYGDAPFQITATATSKLLVTFTVVKGPATISGSTLTITGAGAVTVEADQAGGGGYLPAPAVQQTFTVAKAALTVAANSLSRPQNLPNPTLTYTITGFVGNDTQASATTGQPALSTTALQSSSPGSYPITVTAGTLAAANYTWVFVSSSLQVFQKNPTTTTLALSTANATTQQVVTLTATVATSEGIVPGTVTFLDSNGQILGTVQLVGAYPLPGFTLGKATLKRTFAPGQHLIQAAFNGTGIYAISSSTRQSLTISGTRPSVTTLTAQPNGATPANTDLTATVLGLGSQQPTGLVNLNDVTAGSLLGSVAPSSAVTNRFQVQQFSSGAATGEVATGDFNGDGIQDVVLTGHGVIIVLLGRPDGTFAAPVTYPAGTDGQALAVGDFNADGALDIAMGNYLDGSIIVLLGKGDGTFQPQRTYAIPAPSDPYGIVVADLNLDGIPDLVVAQNNGQTAATVMLGNGDGTFNSPQNYGTGGSQGIVVGDFNGDGVPDIAASTGSNVAVLLGYGNGTFQPQRNSPANGITITAGDFNGDGKLDVALANAASVVVALGNGDGTFSPPVSYPSPANARSIATADFNKDGFADLVVSDTSSPTGGTGLLLGKGDGTFQNPQVYNVGGALGGIAIADLNGDGMPDIVTINPAVGQFAVLLDGMLDTASFSNVSVVGVGQHTISASYAPDPASIYAASVSNTVTVNAQLLVQTISFSPIPNQVYGNGPFALTAAASSNLPVTFSVVSGPAIIAGNMLTIRGAGTVTVQADQGGNSTYSAATAQQSFTIAKAVLTVTAASASILQGQAIPAFTETTVGFVNGDSPSVLSGTPSITTTATSSSPAGSYPIVAAQGTLSAANYSFRFVNAALTIAPSQVFSGISPQEIAAGATGLTLTVTGNNFNPYIVILANGAPLTTHYSGPTQLTATLPAALLAKPGTIQIQLQEATFTSAGVPLTVVPDVVFTALTPSVVVAQSPTTTITAAGSNFTSTTVLQFNGAPLSTTFINAGQIKATVPAANLTTAQTAQIMAFDPASGSQSAAVAFHILATPAIVFTGPSTADPGTQPVLNFQISQPYPIALTGTMTLTFQPSAGEPDDPSIQFASGGRTFTFTLPANTSSTPPGQLQAGTVAGTITVTLTLFANGVNVTPSTLAPVVIVIPKSVPVITKQSIVRNGNSLTIYVTGYSSSRDMVNAYFTFTPVQEIHLAQSSFTLPVTTLFSSWYSSAPSNPYGSAFTYFQTFSLDNPATQVQSVTVTLENAQGKSQTEVVQ